MRRDLRDVDYLEKLSKQDKEWLYKAAIGIRSANRNLLAELADEEEIIARVWEACKSARAGRYKDLMVQGERQSTLFNTNSEICLSTYEGVLDMSAIENAIINALDTDVSSTSFTPYGGNAHITVGDKVIVAIEDHVLQNKQSVVVGTRRNEFLIEAVTSKGKVQAYFKANELLKV